MHSSFIRSSVALVSGAAVVAVVSGATLLAPLFASAATPVISNIAVSDIASTTVTITWDTDVAADSQVMYGMMSTYDASSTLMSATSTSHTAYLGGLLPSTTYHFQVRANGVDGLATSTDQTFTTSGSGGGSTASSTPLALLGVDTVRGTATPNGNFSDGWQWIFHFTVPDNETNFAFKLGDFVNQSNSSSTISIANHARYYSTQSGSASTTDSALMMSAADSYGSASLNLIGDISSATAGRQVDIVVDVAVPAGTTAGTYSANFGARSLP